MKTKITLIALLSFAWASAQVLNPSFETWGVLQNEIDVTVTFQGVNVPINDAPFNYNEPDDWSSLNQLTPTASLTDANTGDTLIELITQSTDANDLLSSIRLESRDVTITANVPIFGPVSFDNVAPGLLVSGEFVLDVAQFADDLVNGTNLNSLNPFALAGTGQEIDYFPNTLSGSYKYEGINGDSALIVTGVVKDREVIAYSITRLPNASTWTNFSLDYEYIGCERPDTIITLISSSNLDVTFANGEFNLNSTTTGENGSELFIDGLSLDSLPASAFPPIALDDNSSILVNEVATEDVVDNDEACDGTMLTPDIISNGSNGNAVVNANGELEYTPNAGFSGTDEVSYEVCNAAPACDTAIWTITINAIPQCDAEDDFRTLVTNTVSSFDPALNDDNCGTALDIIVLPVNGTASVTNGQISYTPVNNFIGSDSLTYAICNVNDATQCDTAQVFYSILTSIREIPSSAIRLAPNPAKDMLNIGLINISEETSVSIYNMLGKLVYTNSFVNNIDVDLARFQTGIYLVQLENSKGKAVQKLIVSK